LLRFAFHGRIAHALPTFAGWVLAVFGKTARSPAQRCGVFGKVCGVWEKPVAFGKSLWRFGAD